MSTRTIIEIDESRCTGCGLCIPNCPEGALQVIDGKARLVSDLFCDGLGACVGYCPEGAITTVEREAEPYDEERVMERIVPQGENTIRAHLEHLRAHGANDLLSTAERVLAARGITVAPAPTAQGCPACAAKGAHAATAARPVTAAAHGAGHAATVAAPGQRAGASGQQTGALTNWPIQLHLLSPMAPDFSGADVLLSADCVAHAASDFHARHLPGKMLAIACPKLDEGKDVYRDKLVALIDHAKVRSITVAMMEVPCCRGLLALVQQARERARRSVPVRALIVGIATGAVLADQEIV
ncbi:MAG TPA: 4Fe-4S binding protein [Spirochaetia bacterium]